MKNIEEMSEWQQLANKFDDITNEANKLLQSNLDENNTLSEIKKIFNKLTRIAKDNINKIKTEEDFISFLKWFEQVFKKLDIAKLYNSTNRWNYENFDNLNLFKQFFYITTPLMTTKSFSFIKWWVCYHWSLFFNNLFSEIDKNNKLSKELIIFNPTYDHGVFQIWFKNKKFIIDPYAKENWLITEVKKWNKIYLNNVWGKPIYWDIKNSKIMKLKVWKWNLEAQIFNNKKDFIENIQDSNELINIKTYFKWKPIHIVIDDIWKDIMINYKLDVFIKEKEFSLIDLVWLYMEWKKVKKIDILLALTWFDKNSISKEILDELQIIAEKIDTNYLFKKLKIDKDIEMFRNM